MFAKKMVFLGVLMLLVSFMAPTWANVVSSGDSLRSGFGLVAVNDDRKSQIDDIVRGIGKPKLQQDANGRVTRIEIERGDYIEFRYDREGLPVPHKSMLNGKHYGPKATLVLLDVLQMRQPLRVAGAGTNIFPVARTMPQLSRAEFGFRRVQNYLQSDALGCNGDPLCEHEKQVADCASNPACFGMWDSINSFVGNFANWLGVGGAVGGSVGLVLGMYQGLQLGALATLTGITAMAGAAIVVAGTGGWLIGTAINGGIEWVIYRNP